MPCRLRTVGRVTLTVHARTSNAIRDSVWTRPRSDRSDKFSRKFNSRTPESEFRWRSCSNEFDRKLIQIFWTQSWFLRSKHKDNINKQNRFKKCFVKDCQGKMIISTYKMYSVALNVLTWWFVRGQWFFKAKWAFQGLLFIYFLFSNNWKILQQINVKNEPSSIRWWD